MQANEPGMQKWKPGVSKTILLLTAGGVWLGVGGLLNGRAVVWLQGLACQAIAWRAGVALAGALVVHHWGFLRIVDRNLGRILPIQGRLCFFAFIPWKSYLVILLMIAMGIGLRLSAIPRKDLAMIYMAIGTALMLSSIRYLRHLWRTLRRGNSA